MVEYAQLSGPIDYLLRKRTRRIYTKRQKKGLSYTRKTLSLFLYKPIYVGEDLWENISERTASAGKPMKI